MFAQRLKLHYTLWKIQRFLERMVRIEIRYVVADEVML